MIMLSSSGDGISGAATMLRPALEAAGFRIEHSEGSIYLWATRDEDCHASVDFLARKGILVAPGDFYGAAATQARTRCPYRDR